MDSDEDDIGENVDSDSDDGDVFEGEAGEAGGRSGTRPPRDRAGEPWGPFFIAPVRESRAVGGEVLKVHIGYGATCGCHRNRTDAKTVQCKLQRSGTSDRTRRVVAQWLLLGAMVDRSSHTARHDHLQLGVALCHEEEPPTWEELTDERVRLFGS